MLGAANAREPVPMTPNHENLSGSRPQTNAPGAIKRDSQVISPSRNFERTPLNLGANGVTKEFANILHKSK